MLPAIARRQGLMLGLTMLNLRGAKRARKGWLVIVLCSIWSSLRSSRHSLLSAASLRSSSLSPLLNELDGRDVVHDLRNDNVTPGPRGNDEEGHTESHADWLGRGVERVKVAGVHVKFSVGCDGGDAVFVVHGRGGGPTVVVKLSSFVVVQDKHGLGVDVWVGLEGLEYPGGEILPGRGVVGSVLCDERSKSRKGLG